MFAFDEGRFGLKTWCRRRWCPRGSRPPWVIQDEYEWLWVYVAIEPTQGTCHVLLLPHVNGDWLQVYLESLRTVTGTDQVRVVLDNAPSHKNHAVVWPAGISPLYLPPYSPELNPAEQVFRQLRQWLANRVFTDVEDLQEALIATLQTFWDDPHLIVRLTNYPWWQAAVPPVLSLSS